DDLLGAELEILRQLVGRGRAPPSRSEPLLGVADLQRALLMPTRDMHRPARVTEVTAHLAQDRRDGKGRERVSEIGIKSLYGLQQAQQRHLEQVVEGLRRAVVAARERSRERHVLAHERLPRRRVTRAAARKQLKIA